MATVLKDLQEKSEQIEYVKNSRKEKGAKV